MKAIALILAALALTVSVAQAEPCTNTCERFWPHSSMPKAGKKIADIIDVILAKQGGSPEQKVQVASDIAVYHYMSWFSGTKSNIGTIRMIQSKCGHGAVYGETVYTLAAMVYMTKTAPADAFQQLKACKR